MDIKHLRYFLEVARLRSFSRAAETLHVSQSAISKMVKDLEGELGLFLFNRDAKQIQLTESGESFLQHAQEVVALFNNLPLEVISASRLDKGRISIGLPPITGATRFARLLGEFKKVYPKIEIALFEYGSKTIEAGILDGSLDIGIICNAPNLESYHAFILSNDPLFVITSPDNPISSLPDVELTSLRHEKFVMYRNDFSLHHEIVNGCISAGFKPEIIFETTQRELMTQIVSANLGIALLPGKTCAELSPGSITAVPLVRPQMFHQMSVIWKKGRHINRPAQLWIDFAKGYLTY
jgi:DNA-binding transcriptional LysR family regulator